MEDSREADLPKLHEIARECRVQIIRMITHAGSGHPGGSLSVIDILVALYFGTRMRYDPRRPHWEDRDRLVLSKGHAVPALVRLHGREPASSPRAACPRSGSSAARCRGTPTARCSRASRPPPGRSARGSRWRMGMALGLQLAARASRVYCCSATARSRRARSGRPRCRRRSSARPTTARQPLRDPRLQRHPARRPREEGHRPRAGRRQVAARSAGPCIDIDGHDIAQIDKALDQARGHQAASPRSSSPTP